MGSPVVSSDWLIVAISTPESKKGLRFIRRKKK